MHKRQWIWRKDKLVLNLSAVCVTPSLQRGLPWVWASPCPGTDPQGLQRGLCSGTWSSSCPSCRDLGGCRAIPLTYPHSLQLPLHWSFPFLILFFTIADGLSPGRWHWLHWTWGKLLAAFHCSHPYTLHHQNLAMQPPYNS